MQYIFKQSQTTHFYQGINAIAQDGSLSDRAARILQYAISLPEDWRIIPRQLMKHFGWGRDVTYKALKELRKRGYAVLVRCRRAATWYVFNTPQTPETLATFTASNQPEPTPDAAPKNPDFKNSTNSDALQKTKHSQRTKETTTAIEPIQAIEKPDVVVIQGNVDQKGVAKPDTLEEHTLTKAIDDTQQAITGIPDKHQPTARQALRTLTKEEADAVVTALTLALSKGSVQNPIGYLLQLVKASKNGTFSPVEAAGGAPVITLAERIRREQERHHEAQNRGKMTNEQYTEWLQRTYGGKAEASTKPAKRVGLRQSLGWI